MRENKGKRWESNPFSQSGASSELQAAHSMRGCGPERVHVLTAEEEFESWAVQKLSVVLWQRPLPRATLVSKAAGDHAGEINPPSLWHQISMLLFPQRQ